MFHHCNNCPPQHYSPSGKRLASIRLAPDRISFERNVKWAYRKLSADLDVAIGINYKGMHNNL